MLVFDTLLNNGYSITTNKDKKFFIEMQNTIFSPVAEFLQCRQRESPQGITPYYKVFNSPENFNDTNNHIVFELALLNKRLPTGNIVLNTRSLQYILAQLITRFKQRLNTFRQSLVKEYLQSSDNSIIDIVYSLVFFESSYFNRTFKYLFQETPIHFRIKSRICLVS
jgi:AraC-like DNA-binding protein